MLLPALRGGRALIGTLSTASSPHRRGVPPGEGLSLPCRIYPALGKNFFGEFVALQPCILGTLYRAPGTHHQSIPDAEPQFTLRELDQPRLRSERYLAFKRQKRCS